jgi:hypothetical protein
MSCGGGSCRYWADLRTNQLVPVRSRGSCTSRCPMSAITCEFSPIARRSPWLTPNPFGVRCSTSIDPIRHSSASRGWPACSASTRRPKRRRALKSGGRMTLDQLHAPPDCNLAPGLSTAVRLTSKMLLPLDRTSLPNFVSPGSCRCPVRRDLRAGDSNVQCNLCLDTKSLEQKWWARPNAMGRARVTDLRRLPNADCRRQCLALGDSHRDLTSLRSRAWDYLRPPKRDRFPAAPEKELLKKSLTVLTVLPISLLYGQQTPFNAGQLASQKS